MSTYQPIKNQCIKWWIWVDKGGQVDKVDRWTRILYRVFKFFFFKITHYENTSLHILL